MKTTSLAVLAAALALAGAGCTVDNDASIEIFALCAPPDDAAECAMGGSCEAMLASPRPWVATTVGGQVNGLVQWMQVNNQMPPNENVELGRVNTNDFIGGEYLLSFRGLPNLSDVVYPANFTVAAGTSTTPVVTLIPMSTMAQIMPSVAAGASAVVIVELRLRGELRDGTEIETGPFEVAVDVINSDFPGFACPVGEVVTAVCPNDGQTASVACEAP